MRVSAVAVIIMALVLPLAAQSGDGNRFRDQIWEIGPWFSAGKGLGKSSDFTFINAGGRIGHVLTDEIGGGPLRGTFEWSADVAPLWLVQQPELGAPGKEWVYGAGLSPVILKWNFTASERATPYVAAEAGVLFTTQDVPAGHTSRINFSPGLAVGTYFLQGRRSALDVSLHLRHISNASLGTENPGINITALVRVGYTWFK